MPTPTPTPMPMLAPTLTGLEAKTVFTQSSLVGEHSLYCEGQIWSITSVKITEAGTLCNVIN